MDQLEEADSQQGAAEKEDAANGEGQRRDHAQSTGDQYKHAQRQQPAPVTRAFFDDDHFRRVKPSAGKVRNSVHKISWFLAKPRRAPERRGTWTLRRGIKLTRRACTQCAPTASCSN